MSDYPYDPSDLGDPEPREEHTAAVLRDLSIEAQIAAEEQAEFWRLDETVWRLCVEDLERIAGRRLTEDELHRFGDAFGNSSVMESVETVLYAVMKG